MSIARLPKQIDPIKLAEMRRHLEGTLALSLMPRLCDLLHDTAGEVTVVLDFGVDIQGLQYIAGEAKVDVELICQRCMQPFKYALSSQINLSPVKDDSTALMLPGDYEPLMLKDEPIELVEMIEEELILSMPLVALHKPKACTIHIKSTESLPKKANPFEILKSLKDNLATDD